MRVAKLLGLWSLVSLTSLAVGCDDDDEEETLTFMTRNLYIGTNLDPVIGAPADQLQAAASAAWAAVKRVNVPGAPLPERFAALADEIAREEPDLVGLQEVYQFFTQSPPDGPATRATTPSFDNLEALLAGLRARGADYRVVASVTDSDLELPLVDLDLGQPIDVRIVDRDVILAREGVETQEPAGLGSSGNFTAALPVPLGGASVNVLRGWTAVDARVDGTLVRFVNTHLESAGGDVVRLPQATELLSRLDAAAAAGARPTVLVGDLNSRPGEPTYQAVVGAGFTDAWAQANPGQPGFTCCQAPDLRNPESLLDAQQQRIDFILYRGPFSATRAVRVGAEPAERTPSGLWPSDHAGVVGTLRLSR